MLQCWHMVHRKTTESFNKTCSQASWCGLMNIVWGASWHKLKNTDMVCAFFLIPVSTRTFKQRLNQERWKLTWDMNSGYKKTLNLNCGPLTLLLDWYWAHSTLLPDLVVIFLVQLRGRWRQKSARDQSARHHCCFLFLAARKGAPASTD